MESDAGSSGAGGLRLVGTGERAAPVREPNPEAIKMLEELLEAAKSGELQSFAFAGIHHREGQEFTGKGWTLGRWARNPILLIGALELVKSRVFLAVE